jgi:hypothetical protein
MDSHRPARVISGDLPCCRGNMSSPSTLISAAAVFVQHSKQCGLNGTPPASGLPDGVADRPGQKDRLFVPVLCHAAEATSARQITVATRHRHIASEPSHLLSAARPPGAPAPPATRAGSTPSPTPTAASERLAPVGARRRWERTARGERDKHPLPHSPLAYAAPSGRARQFTPTRLSSSKLR